MYDTAIRRRAYFIIKGNNVFTTKSSIVNFLYSFWSTHDCNMSRYLGPWNITKQIYNRIIYWSIKHNELSLEDLLKLFLLKMILIKKDFHGRSNWGQQCHFISRHDNNYIWSHDDEVMINEKELWVYCQVAVVFYVSFSISVITQKKSSLM